MRKTPLSLAIVSVLGLSALVAACNTTGNASDGYSGSSLSNGTVVGGGASQSNSGDTANGISKGQGDTGHSVPSH